MPRKKLIRWPEGEKRTVYLTFKRVEEVFGIPESTIRNWHRKTGNGLKTYRVGGRLVGGRLVGGRLCVMCDEFIAWLNLVTVEVSQVRRFSFSSESNIRGMEAPEAAIVNQTRVPVLHRGRKI